MRMVKKIIRTILDMLYIMLAFAVRLVSLFTPKKKTAIICFPEWTTCVSNHVDIINYTADNTLSFINYLLQNYKGIKLTVYLFCYENRIDSYVDYVDSLKNSSLKIVFIYYNKKSLKSQLVWLAYFLRSKYIFTSNVCEQRFAYKLKKQTYISLNYFATSLKLDKTHRSYKWSVEHVISTSCLSSQIIATFSMVPIKNFISLGFPRNDNIVNPRYSREQQINLLKLPFKADKIILHTPTHRMGHSKSTKNDVIYYNDSNKGLSSILNKHNAVLIIVSHPGEQLTIEVAGKNDRIILYKPNHQYTLYDMLSHADFLITDYTTVYYDFLLTNRPVIFNFYDKDFYEQERGFAFDPVESICAGTIVKSKEELFNAIQQTLAGIDEHKQHRKFVTSLIHKHVDSNASKRILEFFETKIMQ